MRAVIYARYSSDLQSAASIEDQLRVCTARAAREGWDVVDTFTDAAISGATTLRPGYQAMLARLRAGGIDVVLAESLDRFSRDQEHIAALYKQTQFAGTRIVTLAEGEVSELHIGLKGTMGALFLKDLAAKTRRGLEGRIRAGRAVGTPSYGYRVVRRLTDAGEIDRGLREIDPDKAAIVQRIFRDYAAGASTWRIAHRLNNEGIPGPGGGLWYDATIRGRPRRGDGLLRNATYAGEIVWSRRHSAKDPMTGQTIRRYSKAEAIVTQATPQLRIIEPELWERVQQRLANESATPCPPDASASSAFWEKRRPRYLLSGKVFCGCCGRAASLYGQDYLGCPLARYGGCDNRRTIRRSKLEAQVFGALSTQLMQPQHLALFIAEFNAESQRIAAEWRSQTENQRRERAAIERRIAHLVEAIADGRGHASLMAKLAELEAQVAAIPEVSEEASTRAAGAAPQHGGNLPHQGRPPAGSPRESRQPGSAGSRPGPDRPGDPHPARKRRRPARRGNHRQPARHAPRQPAGSRQPTDKGHKSGRRS